MKITVLTLFNELFEMYLSQTILNRAVDKNIVEYHIENIRDYATNKHKQIDDKPFGGGNGMVLKPEPFFNYFFKLKEQNRKPYVVFVTPQGKPFNQEKVRELIDKEDLVIISGRYEGLDQRVIDSFVDEEISIGDYVLTSGDLPTLVIIDAIVRQKDGVIKEQSYKTDSFFNGLLGFPQYTVPATLGRHKVPEILLSGNHKKIDEFKEIESLKKTLINRPDLINNKMKDKQFSKKFSKILDKIMEVK